MRALKPRPLRHEPVKENSPSTITLGNSETITKTNIPKR